MRHIDLPTLFEHLGYAFAVALVAGLLSWGAGWGFAKLAHRMKAAGGIPALLAAWFPVRAVVFGVVGIAYLSHVGMMWYITAFGLTSNWLFVSVAVSLTALGTRAVASDRLRAWRQRETKGTPWISLVHSFFVAAPWLCLKPGRYVGGGGVGSVEMKGVITMNMELLNEVVIVIALLALIVDWLFLGATRVWLNPAGEGS